MRDSVKDKLDPRILAITIIVALFEFETFAFAKGVVKFAKQDAWISVLLGGLIGLAGTFLLVKLAERFPKENFFQFNKKIWGQPLAFIIAVASLVYWLGYLVILYKDTSMATEYFFLKRTPTLIPMALFAGVVLWLAVYGLTSIVRFFQIFVWFLILPLIFVSILFLSAVDFKNFFPVMSHGILPVILGAVYYAGALQGLEVILFLMPFISDTKKTVTPALIGTGTVFLITFVHIIGAVGILGVERVQKEVYPGVATMTIPEIPGMMGDRYELFLTLPWITGVFATIALFTYLVSDGFGQIFNIKYKKAIVIAVSLLIITGAFLIPNLAWASMLRENLNFITFSFVYILPIITFIITAIRKKRGTNE